MTENVSREQKSSEWPSENRSAELRRHLHLTADSVSQNRLSDTDKTRHVFTTQILRYVHFGPRQFWPMTFFFHILLQTTALAVQSLFSTSMHVQALSIHSVWEKNCRRPHTQRINWKRTTVCNTARFVSGMRKYDRELSDLWHNELHWIDVQTESSSNLVWLFIIVCHTRHLSISSTTAHLSLKSLVGGIYDQPVVTNWSYHATNDPRSATGILLLLVQQSGTRCEMISGILDAPLEVSDSPWKLSFSRPTSALVASMTMCYINSRLTFDTDTSQHRLLPDIACSQLLTTVICEFLTPDPSSFEKWD